MSKKGGEAPMQISPSQAHLSSSDEEQLYTDCVRSTYGRTAGRQALARRSLHSLAVSHAKLSLKIVKLEVKIMGPKRSRSRTREGAPSSSVDSEQVEVLEVPPADQRKKSPTRRGASEVAHLASTPLGTPSSKRAKMGNHQISPLTNLEPKLNSGQDAVVTVVSPTPKDAPDDQSGSSDESFEMVRRDAVVVHERSPSTELSESLGSVSLQDSSSSFQNQSDLESGNDVQDGSPGNDSEDNSGIRDISDSLGDAGSLPYRIFQLATQSSHPMYLLLLPGGVRLPLRGLAQLKSLFGRVSVLGYEIGPQMEEPVPVFSPLKVSFLCLETNEDPHNRWLTDEERSELNEKLTSLQIIEDPDAVTSEMMSDSVLLLASNLQHAPKKHITSYDDQNFKHLFAVGNMKKNIAKEHLNICKQVGLFLDPSASHGPSVFHCLNGYEETTSRILFDCGGDDARPCVMFAGAKNSGKSTCIRYIINNLQNRGQDVCYLECDPGQTEFTAPAILSLHEVKQPLIGPPFTHQNVPIKAYFLGVVNVADHADRFLEMISILFAEYKEKFSHLPLFINTMGWVEGLGLRLLKEVARITQPTHMVQMDPQEQPVSLLQKDDGDRFFQLKFQQVNALREPQMFLPIKANPQSDSIQSSSQRELNLLAALTPLLDPVALFNPSIMDKGLVSVRPRVVPWDQVVVHVCHADIPPRDLCRVANASLLGLCCTSDDEMKRVGTQEVKGLRTFRSTPVSECLGVGILRHINFERRIFYILPAVPDGDLPRINTLVIGALSVPDCIFNEVSSSKQQAPYMCPNYDNEITGSRPLKAKSYLKR
ncbi:polynucleotide 5'-hydroxyl-kinase NOL9-like [Diadema setosum]|uniref:polynucleotide 5'-hydroxyl-kinase NOL9-like n=1 Tax=Diadema setosum TaxID=31175 RepID=UPI003B3BACAA